MTDPYAALTVGAGVIDFSARTQIELRGEDRATFLHNFCTNDVNRLTPGGGCEAFITNAQGKILAHVLIFCGQQSLTLEHLFEVGRCQKHSRDFIRAVC